MDSTVKYGQELGRNLKKIATKLAKNQNLLKLLINTDKDPLNSSLHPDEINALTEILNKYIKVVPLILNEDLTVASKIVLFFEKGEISEGNSDNENIRLLVNVYCPFKQWLITGDDLRPFAIMSEIRKSLQDKRINGLGEIKYINFDLQTLTEEMGCYSLEFIINAFS